MRFQITVAYHVESYTGWIENGKQMANTVERWQILF